MKFLAVFLITLVVSHGNSKFVHSVILRILQVLGITSSEPLLDLYSDDNDGATDLSKVNMTAIDSDEVEDLSLENNSTSQEYEKERVRMSKILLPNGNSTESSREEVLDELTPDLGEQTKAPNSSPKYFISSYLIVVSLCLKFM